MNKCYCQRDYRCMCIELEQGLNENMNYDDFLGGRK